MTSPSRFEES